MIINILDFIIYTFSQEQNNLPKSKITQIIVIDCKNLNIDEMLVYPTVEQYALQYPILTPTVKFHSHNSQSPHLDSTPAITIELRKPTIDQLLCYPTVEQYNLTDNILTPTICSITYESIIRNQICPSLSSEITSTILIHFGKPF
ncbi:hypothetical protein CEXT_55291 [Caerostris extrusa]|uniref:Uncharacterized protein n=1 Tax=Caerostris extrusa TaxID=172846 RepID=A0AAV4XR89_CAEEX|nr:hypothetical protein CEXT_55291 [Caerostris extrusa]